MGEEEVSLYADSLLPIRLEGILDYPESDPPHPGCILCHPDPVGGGSMDVPLLETLAHVFSSAGWSCLRFNFRGVGGSTGESTGGIKEIEDIEGAYRWIHERKDVEASDISLAGWSFGSWVGMRWALRGAECRRLVLISPPLIGFDFFNLMTDEQVSLSADVLIVSGERDQFSNGERLQDLARKLEAELFIIAGADHFLFGREREVADTILGHWRQARNPQ
jgi:alpha/beta superfamily hydrolase